MQDIVFFFLHLLILSSYQNSVIIKFELLFVLFLFTGMLCNVFQSLFDVFHDFLCFRLCLNSTFSGWLNLHIKHWLHQIE